MIEVIKEMLELCFLKISRGLKGQGGDIVTFTAGDTFLTDQTSSQKDSNGIQK